MRRSEEPNIGLPILGNIRNSILFLLGYVTLRMVQRKKMRSQKMKAAVKAMRNKEMDSFKASRIYIISLPSHSSHKMPPLDKVFMGPPKTFYGKEAEQ
jgi:hypothetical protein